MPERYATLIYDPIMLEHRPPPGHPERPDRLKSVVDHIRNCGLWDRCAHPEARPATVDEIARIHRREYIERVRAVSLAGGGVLDHGDTVASPLSWDAATMAAGAAIGAVDAALGPNKVGFALARPPGHHATPEGAMGFCFFNNISVAAVHARERHGIRRAMIVDFDVHHGNGTQDAFYDDDSVLFLSIHQYPAYPGTGPLTDTGRGAAKGATINVPIPSGIGNEGYLRIMSQVVEPAADLFKPELLLISAGYDAHWKNSRYVAGIDERMTAEGYHGIAGRLLGIAERHCDGRLAAVLEGGYDLGGLCSGVENTIRSWLGDEPILDPAGSPPSGADDLNVEPVIHQVRQIHLLE